MMMSLYVSGAVQWRNSSCNNLMSNCWHAISPARTRDLALGYPALLRKEGGLRVVVEILAELKSDEEDPFPVKDATHAVRERRRRRPAQVRFAPCSPSNLRFEASNQGCLFTSSPPRPPPPSKAASG